MTMEQQQLQILETYYPDRHTRNCVYPSKFPSSRSQKNQAGEEAEHRVYVMLSQIDEPMFVMHSKKFCVLKSGEGAFLIFSKEKGIIILEVKSGKQIPDYNEAKEQLEKAQAAVKMKLKKICRKVSVRYAVVMPNVSRQYDNPPHVEGCYGEDLVSRETFAYWLNTYMPPEDQRKLNNDEYDKCLACFLSVILTGYDFNTIHSHLNSLTPKQAEILEVLDEEVYITGPAGSGKTACLVIKASSEELKEQRKLVVVFNRPLRDHLGKNHLLRVENIQVMTFQQLLHDIIGERKRQEVINNQNNHVNLVDTAIQITLSESGYSERFDSIFVDEAQDLFGNWELLFDVLHEKGEGHYKWIFYDNNQKVRYSAPPTRNKHEYHLTKVIRNTKKIFEASKLFYSSKKTVKIAHNIEGPEVVQRCFTDHDIENMNPNVIQFILDAIVYLSKCLEVIRPGDICVLMESKNRANMAGEKIHEQSNGKIVPFLLDRMVEFLQDGNWPRNEIVDRGNIGVTVDSVSRFKGLESKAVILVIGAPETCKVLEKTYVGTTRAICHLTFIYSSFVERFLKSKIANT